MPYKKGQKWVAQVRLNGKRKEKIFLSKREATAWESESRLNPEEIWPEKTNTVLLFEWAQAYLNFAKATFAHVTYDEKRSMFRRFFMKRENEPDLSILPVSKLTPAHIQTYVTRQKLERSGYAANKDRKNLLAAWAWGMEYMNPTLPGPNPCQVKKMSEIRHPRYVPTEEDFWKAYNVASGQDRVMLLAFLHLAARRGEIFRLTWDDVDFDVDRIRLWTRKREGGHFEYSWLPMTKILKEALLWWQENRPIKSSPYVFLCLEEKHFCQESYGKPFKCRQHFMGHLCKRAGVKHFGFHAIRHLTASTLYKLGFALADIQSVLRHQSATTTAKYIRSLGLEGVRPALEALSNQKGRILVFKPIEIGEGEKPYQNEKAVSGAVNS
jgi:integrase